MSSFSKLSRLALFLLASVLVGCSSGSDTDVVDADEAFLAEEAAQMEDYEQQMEDEFGQGP